MIKYEEDHLFPLLFRLDGSVYARSASYSIASLVVSLVLCLLQRHFPEYYEDLNSRLVLDRVAASQVWSATTVVVVFLVSFRTRQGLARFWEGTGLLHQMKGEWFDTVSNCITFTIAARCETKDKKQMVDAFRHTIVRLMSLAHGSALEEISGNSTVLETIDVRGLNNTTLLHLKDCVEHHHFNKVEVLLHMVQSLITDAHERGIVKIPPPILSRVYQTISRGYVNLLNTKKITDTKFPFPYVQMITFLLMLNTVLTPMIISVTINSIILAPIIAFTFVFGCYALNFIAIELEDPFGPDPNDLPLEAFQAEMNNCLMMLLHTNTDLIPGISDRCIMGFEELKSTVESLNFHRAEEGERRCSFNFDSPVHGDLLGSKIGSNASIKPTVSTVTTTPSQAAAKGGSITSTQSQDKKGSSNLFSADFNLGEITGMMTPNYSQATDQSSPQHQSSPQRFRSEGNLQAAPDTEKQIGGSGRQGLQEELHTTAKELEAHPTAGGAPTIYGAPPMGRLSRCAEQDESLDDRHNAACTHVSPQPRLMKKRALETVLVKSMEEFNRSLQSWTQMMEAQVKELSDRFINLDEVQTWGALPVA